MMKKNLETCLLNFKIIDIKKMSGLDTYTINYKFASINFILKF